MSFISYCIGVFIGLLIAFFVFLAVQLSSTKPLDATDNHITGIRSNLTILVDHGTGCEYLKSVSGGLTPRINPQGKHICAITLTDNH